MRLATGPIILWSFAAYTPVSPLFAEHQLGPLSATQAISGVCLLVCIYYLLTTPNATTAKSCSAPLFCLAAYSGLVGMHTTDTDIGGLLEAMRLLLLALTIRVASNETYLGRLSSRSVMHMALLTTAIYISLQLAGRAAGTDVYGSTVATAGLTNQASTAAIVACSAPAFLLGGRWSIVAIAGLLLATASTGLTMRRSATLACAFVIAYTCATRGLRREQPMAVRCFTLLLLGIIAIGTSWLLGNTAWGEEFSTRLADLRIWADGTGSGRTDLASVALSHISERGFASTLFGEGPDGFLIATEHWIGSRIETHNDFLHFPIAYGVVGSLLVVSFFTMIALRIAKTRGHLRDTLVATFGVFLILAGAAGSLFTPVSLVGFIVLGHSESLMSN